MCADCRYYINWQQKLFGRIYWYVYLHWIHHAMKSYKERKTDNYICQWEHSMNWLNIFKIIYWLKFQFLKLPENLMIYNSWVPFVPLISQLRQPLPHSYPGLQQVENHLCCFLYHDYQTDPVIISINYYIKHHRRQQHLSEFR